MGAEEEERAQMDPAEQEGLFVYKSLQAHSTLPQVHDVYSGVQCNACLNLETLLY
jgi:hypothetical protein